MNEIIRNISNSFLSNAEVASDFKNRNIAKHKTGNIVLIGMRRLGKTEYLKYRFQISKLSKEQTIFIDFDSSHLNFINFQERGGLKQKFINSLISLLNLGKTKLVLFDEIQHVKEWSRILKGLIDQFPNISFIATGSDAIQLNKSLEHGVDRFKIKYVGVMTYLEFLKSHPTKSFLEYMNYFSFPQGNKFDLESRYESVIEKQVRISNLKKINVDNVIRAIALNPGMKVTMNNLSTIVKSQSASNADSKQVKNILKFLIESSIIISIPDKYALERKTKNNTYTLYPFDWNTYSYFSTNKNYEDHPSYIETEKEDKNLPTKGFIFENMIISNVYSILDSNLLKNTIFNKIEKPDLDLIINDNGYEIKSFDVLNSSETTLLEIVEKAKKNNATIIHLGKTKKINKINLLNWIDFLKDIV